MPPRKTRSEITKWTQEVLSRLGANRQTEDSFAELKAKWPDPTKAARQLAAQANAARGEDILWVIGADERRGIVGTDPEEISTWWSQIERQFDLPAPGMTEVVVDLDDSPPVVALCFRTSEVPFVVRTGADAPDREIPWREGTRARSAKRHEILSLFEPQAEIPRASFLRGSVTTRVVEGALEWILVADVYLDADPSRTTIISAFECTGQLRSPELRITTPLERFTFLRAMTPDPLVQVVEDKVVLRGPGIANLRAGATSGTPMGTHATPSGDLEVELDLPVAGTSGALRFEESFVAARPDERTYGVWVRTVER